MILEPRKIVCHYLHCFPFYFPWSDGTRCHDLRFLNAESFKPIFSLSCFTFIKRFFSSFSLSSIRVVSYAYLRLLIIFLLAIWILAFDSPSLAFHMIYSAYKLNEQGDNIQPWPTPFPIWNQSVFPYLVLLLLDLHTDFLGGKSGGLVFPSLEEFSTVCCDPHSQRLWYSQ